MISLDVDFGDVNALVIGGNSGIGKEIAERLRGWLGDRDRVHTPTIDELDVNFGAQWFLESYGPFSHVVYTAGVNELRWAQDMTMADYIEAFSINAFGFGVVLGEHKRMFPGEAFSAVAIVSDAMRNPMRGSTAYCASKAALAAIIRNLAREWAPDCRVNGVAPAIVADTPMTDYIDATVPEFRGWDPEKAAAYEKSLLPMGRRVSKIEVAQVVIDVLFGPAYLTGSIIDITGGK